MVRRSARLAALAVAGSVLFGACARSEGNTGASTTTTIAKVSEVGRRRPWDGMVVQPVPGPAGRDQLTEDLTELDALGAPNVALVVPLTESGPGDILQPDPARTPTDPTLGRMVDQARDQGLGVVLQLRVEGWGDTPPSGTAEADRWFSDYARLASHYAALAQDHHVALLVLALPSGPLLSEGEAWTEVLGAVRRSFGGPVSFTTELALVDQVAFWDAVDVIGIEVPQPPTGDESDPIASDLEKAWEPVLARLTTMAERWSRPVVLTRIGFPADAGSDGADADEERAGEEEPGLARSEATDPQSRGYQALFTVINQTPAVDGVLVWHWGNGPGLQPSYSPEGRPAEDVLRRAWTTPLADDAQDGSVEPDTGTEPGDVRPGGGG